MAFRAAFGDVMQEHRYIKHHSVIDKRDHFTSQRMLIAKPLILDFREDPHGPQKMLIDRIMVIHVELHHCDNATEIRNETPEDTSLGHPPQHIFRIPTRGQNAQEDFVGLLVVTQIMINQS